MEKSWRRRSKKNPNVFRYSTPITCKWTEEELLKLIAEVQKYRCLYDETCPPESRNLESRLLAWQAITDSFPNRKFPLKQCRAKWLVMRESYRRNHNAFRETGKTPSWSFYERMSFVVCNIRQERYKLLKLAVELFFRNFY